MNAYTFHFNLLELAVVCLIITGLNLAWLLALTKSVNRAANRFLALALVVTVLWLMHIFAMGSGLPLQFSLALGPLIFFYVLQLTRPEYEIGWRDWLHFIPVLLEQITLLTPVLPLMAFVSVIIYLFESHRLIEGFYSRQIFNQVSDRYRYELRWLQRWLTGIGLSFVLSVPLAFIAGNTYAYKLTYLLLGIMMISLGASVFLKQHVEPDIKGLPLKPLLPIELKQKGMWLKKVIKENGYYQDPELSLSSLAQKLGLTTHELSRIVNQTFKKSFSDLINEYRVAEVVRKMQDPAYDHITLLGIAYGSGFNSKTTFNRAFKLVTGKNPVDYKNEIKKEAPFYNPGRAIRFAAVISNQEKSNRNFMFKNYLKVAWRNLTRNKVSSFINISGLAVGMAVAMLIGLWIWDELSFNKYHQNYDHIFQVMQKQKFLGNIKIWEQMPYKVAGELKSNYNHNFKHIVTATRADHYYLSQGENKILRFGQYIEDAAPEMLTLKMLSGSWAALREPHSVLLSASAAKMLFGDREPMDKTVNVSNTWDVHTNTALKVTGVYEDLPQNTQFHETQFFMPWELFAAGNTQLSNMAWDDHHFLIYAELQTGADPGKVAAAVKGAELKVISHLDNMKQEVAANPELLLNPMKNWHLYSNFKDGVADRGPIRFVWLIGLIGGFVLLLACINFMNLSTARSEKRATEVGIRKAIGSARGQLVSQFFTESLMVAIFSFIVAFLLCILSLPVLNDLAAKQINIPFANIWFWLACLSFILFTGLLAGIYPALYLSSFQPVKVLKGAFRAGRMASLPRKILVVIQFTVSIVLIICTLIVYNQLIFAKSRPVGYSRNGLVLVPMTSMDYFGKYDVLRNELKSTGAVTEVAESESPVTGVSSHNNGFNWKGKDPGIDEDFGTLTVTQEYGKTIGWQFKYGRDFSRGFLTDSSGFVINEAAASYMGLKHPVGETIHWKSKWLKLDKDYKIIGVIKDVVMRSPFDPVQPTIFRLGGNPNWIFIRINPQVSVSEALPKIAGVFKQVIPSVPFEYNFADDEYAKKFAAEEHIGKLTSFFSCLAILISSLGLFGLTAFIAEQRTKEIGVRKVLGAAVFTIWRLLTQDFVLPVLISLLVAAPIAWYAMSRWLQGYSYRTPIDWWVFVLTGIGTLVITLLTVSYQSVKAALANPVKSLRSE